jgi:hypothetical protein
MSTVLGFRMVIGNGMGAQAKRVCVPGHHAAKVMSTLMGALPKNSIGCPGTEFSAVTLQVPEWLRYLKLISGTRSTQVSDSYRYR